MKDKVHVKFPIGNQFFAIEAGSGYAAAHPDSVTVAIRERTAKSTPGRRVAADFTVRRAELTDLGLQILELAQNMSPETLWQESGAVGVAHGRLPRLALPLPEQTLPPIDLEKRIQTTRERYDKLSQRITILRMAQQVLETCDPETAGSLHLLLVCVTHTGKLPMQIVVDAVEQPVKEEPAP
jgi:hypothetical protein